MQTERSYLLTKEADLLHQASDSELIDLIKRDDLQAINVLIHRYRPYVLRLVKQRVESAQVEDITQDILLKVFVNIKKFEQRSLLTTWIYRITLNHLFQYQSISEHDIHQVERSDHHVVNVTDGEHQEEKESNLFLGMTLCMDAEQRMVITLADIFKLDHNAASGIMDISPAGFRKRLSRARKELKNFMTNQCSLMNSKASCKCKFKTKSFQEKGWLTKNTNSFKDKHVETARALVNECAGS